MSSFETKLKQALDERADALDASTLSRLHSARNKALESAPSGWQHSIQNAIADIFPRRQYAAQSALLVTGILALGIYFSAGHWRSNEQLIETTAATSPIEIMELIELDADLELVEDLEFYNWLELQQHQETDA